MTTLEYLQKKYKDKEELTQIEASKELLVAVNRRMTLKAIVDKIDMDYAKGKKV